MSKFVDEETKEEMKAKVDKADNVIKRHKRTIGEILVGVGALAVFSGLLKHTKLKTDAVSFEMGKMAGRAEYAEELAERAVSNGFNK